MAKQTEIQKRINKMAGIKGGVSTSPSVKGKAAGPINKKTGNRLAGGVMQTIGDGRGGKLATRRQRYYDVRVALGLSGG